MESDKNAMVNLTGLWEKRDKNNNIYFSGNMGNATLMIFKNNRKEKENQPDYLMFLCPSKKQEQKETKDEVPF